MTLYTELCEWQPFSLGGAMLEYIVKKSEHSKATRRISVLIWTISNPDYEPSRFIGKFFIVEPARNKSISERLRDGPLFDTLEEAKPEAERMLEAYMTEVKSGAINWWTGRIVR